MIQDANNCPDSAYPLCLQRLASIETKIDVIRDQRLDVENRLRSLEKRDAFVLGASAIISFLIPLMLHLLKLL